MEGRSRASRGFVRGFRAAAPLWLGAAPFGAAYAVIARDAGLSVLETQALSVLVFAGSAQFSAAGMFGRGAAGIEIVLTTFLLNVRHVLYGLSLSRNVPLTRAQLPVAAYFLTDEAYGVAIAAKARTFPFLLGAELSLFVTWNVATLAGSLLGGAIPDPTELGIDIVFPLGFLALLVPLVTTRHEVAVAALAGALAWVLARELPFGVAVLATGLLGSLAGAWLTRGQSPPDDLAHDVAVREVA